MTAGAERIAAERQRQTNEEHFTEFHDQSHNRGDLASAAICYTISYLGSTGCWMDALGEIADNLWPKGWGDVWDKTSHGAGERNYTKIRDLERAGALIAAEIDRELRRQS